MTSKQRAKILSLENENMELRQNLKEYKRTIVKPGIKEIKQIDGDKCKICGSIDILNVHHISPKSLGGSNESENLITLCKSCHLFMHCNPKLIMLEKEMHSRKTKEGLQKAIINGKKIGRPIGTIDKIQRKSRKIINKMGGTFC